ncbi:hypothetical protein MML48_1g07606 [Holotrichia oblita]|uniref:Uncharacterized protein n=1 Tax=Holotrichia oblita TaxID=644536 RepID=A0ACB9TWV6_HOLOL|nr:hypothetical protein MML48_1g07606 [Holotrichia oblita]
MSKLDRTKSLTAQELDERRIRARRRFKAVVHLVIANRRWLEDDQDEQLSRNVKRNVQLLTRKKAKKGLLTLQQKAILCKPAECRTEEEKILLNRIIGGLKCFRKYPEHVKMQLAGVTYFMYFGPNRMIVRQSHEAHALYFLLTGEVAVSITTYDPVIKEKVTINVGTMVAGSMFGEVSLLHDIPRTATITTLTSCELLCLKKADFDIVLKASVKKQWQEIQTAMSKFEYFNGWDEVAVRECCIYSKIKPYIRDQAIVGDGQGVASSVYFILKGQCKIIEHLLVTSSCDNNGRKRYAMYEPESATHIEEEEESKTLLDEMKHSVASLLSEPRVSAFPADLIGSTTSMPSRKSVRPSILKRRTAADVDERASINTTSSRRTRVSIASSYKKKTTTAADENDILSTRDYQSKPTRVQPIISLKNDSVAPSVIDLPHNVETHFMQVGILSERACFGLGENMKRRRVVAMSDYVECLLIPRYWLFQHNRGNLWTKIQQYLDSHIPSTRKVFEEFLNQRRWLRHRRNVMQDIFKRPPVTAYYNIPYSIRINDDIRLD